jgi:tRNA threonylcarbamoyl adenosine modification protein YeaZ
VLVLVIDTSSEAVTAAVVEVRGDLVLPPPVEETTINARGHGELLVPEIQRALAHHDARVGDLGAIVAGTGPGPYTGLRVGLVTAAVLGEALGVPTYGVCSLDGIASAAEYDGAGRLLVLTDARRKEVYWARYADGLRVDGPHVDKPADLPIDASEAIAGQGAALYGIAQPAVRYPSAVALARCAHERIVSGAPSEQLTPLYLRRPDAVAPGTPKQVNQ